MRSVFLVALFAFSSALPAQMQAPERPSGWTDKQPVVTKRWMVAAANPLAVQAGYDVLLRGGTAVDAAVAVQLILGLVEPQSSGLGGGAFMLVHDAKTGKLIAYDGRETAPAAARPDRFLGKDGKPLAFYDAVVGGKSVGVPGTVRLLETVHRKHGKVKWQELFAPAIALADNGFAVSPRLNTMVATDKYLVQDRAKAYFLDADGKPKAVGTILRNPAYASTLRQLSAGGADAFYSGAIAEDVIRTANTHPVNPGDLTRDDLRNYKVRVREPVCDGYRGFRVCGMPLPSSGGLTVLAMLKMLEPYSLKDMGPASFWSVHFISEAGRLAYADRGVYMADPDFYTPPGGLLDPAYLMERSQLIKTTGSMGRAKPGNPPERMGRAQQKVAWGEDAALEFPSTSHISVVDRYGNAVAMTTTIEDAFGSRLMTESGFLLNNELTDFSFVPLDDGKPVANRVEPGKRPRSSMAPTIVYDRQGRVFMVAGSPGGSAIINYVAKTLIGVLDWDLDPQRAIDIGNFGSRNGPTELEKGTPVALLEAQLKAMGHETRVMDQTSGLQAIVRTKTGWIGGADPRREGVVRGE
jgi:gamma-glutamyltranspeptidase/glutathione hydrolase